MYKDIDPTWSWCTIFVYFRIKFANTLLKIFHVCFRACGSMQFSFLVISVRFWYWTDAGITDWVNKCFFCFYLLEEIMENWYQFLPKYLIESTSETIWVSCFPFLMVINYWFNSFNIYINNYILINIFRISFSLCELWEFISFKKLVHFI